MFYWFTDFLLYYFILYIPFSLLYNKVYQFSKKQFKDYSPTFQAHLLILISFAHLILTVSFTYALHHPEDITSVSEHLEQLESAKAIDILVILTVLFLFVFRTIKIFKVKEPVIPLISPMIYEKKLSKYLTSEEILELQVLDTRSVYAYCKGFFRPVIYLSAGLLESLEHEQVHIILLHEKAHIKRADLITGRLFKFLLVFEGYPKVISKFFALWKRKREKACDDEAVKIYSPIMVARTIIRIIKKIEPSPSFSSGFGDVETAYERIDRLMDYKQGSNNEKILIIFWVLLALITCTVLSIKITDFSLDRIMFDLLSKS